MRNRTFHRASIGDMMFDGVVSADGPYLSCQMSGGVALGVSGLRHFKPEHLDGGGAFLLSDGGS